MNKVVLVFAFSILLLVGCSPEISDALIDGFLSSFGESVIVIENDKTSPSVELHIPDLGEGVIVLNENSSPVTINLESTDPFFFLIGSAEDPQGVKEVTVRASAPELRCTNPNDGLGFILTPFGFQVNSVDDAQVGQTALTRRWIPVGMGLGQLDSWCRSYAGPGFQAKSIRISFIAEGKNFSDGIKQSAIATFLLDI